MPLVSAKKNLNSANTNNSNINNNNLNSVRKHNKNHDEDYYHVDTNHITLFVYNYNTGFVEVLKDPKYKISQVVKSTNAEKEKLSKMNAKLITNPKLAKEKKRGTTVIKKSMDDDELDAYSEKKIKKGGK